MSYGGDSGHGSASAAVNRALAWQLIQQHNTSPIRACVILDKDDAGVEERRRLEGNLDSNNRHIKAVYCEVKSKPIGIDNGFKLPMDLEYLYSDEIWNKAKLSDWLLLRDAYNEILTKKMQGKVLLANVNSKTLDLFDGLDEITQIRIKYLFSDDGKNKAAKWIGKRNDEKLRLDLANFDGLLKDIFEFLGLI